MKGNKNKMFKRKTPDIQITGKAGRQRAKLTPWLEVNEPWKIVSHRMENGASKFFSREGTGSNHVKNNRLHDETYT